MKGKIIVGISGGIDSAYTALMLKEQGFEVIGVHLKLTDHSALKESYISKIQSALQIPIGVLDGKNAFKQIVIETFRNDHLAGRTPSPCITCNPELKWKLLNEFAVTNNADLIATGHYIQKVREKSIWYLKKGSDPLKDQSYFLWAIPQEIIRKMHTPLGEYSKQKIKKSVANGSLEFLLNQKESTGLCFAEGLSYPDLIQKYIPEVRNISEGEIMDRDNNVVGRHKGYIYYTIGQKRGLEFYDNVKSPLPVIKIDPANYRLFVGKDEELWIKTFVISNYKFMDKERVERSSQIEVKVRGIGRNPKGYGKVDRIDEHLAKITLEYPAWAMAPGQPVVFYENDLLLGGGLMYRN